MDHRFLKQHVNSLRQPTQGPKRLLFFSAIIYVASAVAPISLVLALGVPHFSNQSRGEMTSI